MPEAKARRGKAVLYARVSTDEQAKKGYPIPEQLGELRAHVARESYRVVGEVADDGYTGPPGPGHGGPGRPGRPGRPGGGSPQ